MTGRMLVLALALVATPALASGYLSGEKLADTISGTTYTWYDGSTSTYNSDRSYVFRGTTDLHGTWRVKGNQVCVTFDSGARECAKYMYKRNALYALTSAGKWLKAVP
jgi:hypothetical protein